MSIAPGPNFLPLSQINIRIANTHMQLRFGDSVSSAWETGGNWACGSIPGPNTDVVIPAGNVVLGSNGTCRSINFKSGATFTVLPGFALTITQ